MKSKSLRGIFLCLSLTFGSLVAMTAEEEQPTEQNFWNSPVFNIGKYKVTPSRLIGGYAKSSAQILLPSFSEKIGDFAIKEQEYKETFLKALWLERATPLMPIIIFTQPTTKEQAVKNAAQAVAVGILTDASYDYLPESFKQYCEKKYEEYIAQPYLEDHPKFNTFVKKTIAPWLTTTIFSALYSQAIDQGRVGFSFTFGEK